MKSEWMALAIRLAAENVEAGRGGPFGAVVVKDGRVVATGTNVVTSANDPTSHAEVVAIRAACKALGTFQLTGCDIYASCEPCPMCLGAIYWARPDRVYYAATYRDASKAGFDDSFLYEQMRLNVSERKLPMTRLEDASALLPFDAWMAKADRIDY
jgi:guanine deaminase